MEANTEVIEIIKIVYMIFAPIIVGCIVGKVVQHDTRVDAVEHGAAEFYIDKHRKRFRWIRSKS